MIATIATILLTFILTGVVGSKVVHAWQHHNWLVQRRIIEAEDQYKTLQKTFDDVSELAGKRQHRMFRLLSSIRSGDDERIKKRLSEYDEATLVWNEKLSTHYARLTQQLTYELSARLENDIQRKFVELDGQLTRCASAKLTGVLLSPQEFGRLSRALNVLHGRIVKFNKATLNEIANKKESLYRPPAFNSRTLDSFPTWELFKALFKPGQHRFNKP